MKKWPLIIPLIAICARLHAQAPNEVVQAELAFAKHAADSSVKSAFLRYLDSNGVVFNQGQIINGIRGWSGAPDGGPKIYWYPGYAAISNAGDMGFTTGPFEVRQSFNDTALVSGQYTTVWKKNRQGEWKFMADLGILFSPSLFNKEKLVVFNGLTPSTDNDSSIYRQEKQLIQAYDSLADEAFRSVITDSSWFNIEGIGPRMGVYSIMQGIRPVPLSLKFEPVSGGIAQSKDLAYVYGHVTYHKRKENYLRIWAHTPDGWKLLLQAIKW